jgi:signal transduction histidine kinase
LVTATKPETPLLLRRWHLLVLAALLVAAYAFIEERYVAERRELVLQQDDIAQALARAYLDDHGPIFEHEGALYAGHYRINWSDTLVSLVLASSGCGLTIFQGDESIATTMVKPGTNERDVGVRAPAQIKERVLGQGQTFRGPVDLVGARWLLVATPLKDGDDAVVGMIATYRDVAALGRELLIFRVTLGGVMLLLFVALAFVVVQVEVQQRKSARARRMLIEDRAKQHAKFFESLTRELRTPLSTLMVFATSLIDSVQDDRSRDVAKRVQGETKELIGLVDDILDYTRLEADSLGLNTAEMDLARIVEQSVETIRARASARSIRLDVDLPAELPKVNGDPMRVQQALTTILATAMRATDEGRIKVRAKVERDTVTIDVTDGGPGISESQVMAIWDPFHSTSAPGRQDAGSGLSLAVTKGLVEKMGGTVEAISKRGSGKGTTLRVRLPRAEVTF